MQGPFSGRISHNLPTVSSISVLTSPRPCSSKSSTRSCLEFEKNSALLVFETSCELTPERFTKRSSIARSLHSTLACTRRIRLLSVWRWWYPKSTRRSNCGASFGILRFKRDVQGWIARTDTVVVWASRAPRRVFLTPEARCIAQARDFASDPIAIPRALTA